MPPIAGRGARVLVLGSMPGARSLAEQQYYAHPQNAFWRAAQVLGLEREWSYARRRAALVRSGIAVWDVLERCVRAGSLDAHIRGARLNDLASFARAHPHLRRVLFNGAKARELYERALRAGDPRARLPEHLELLTLPSTSPANTSKGKLGAWERALRGLADVG
jgi:TDG/mug DNA glycosylase family protein